MLLELESRRRKKERMHMRLLWELWKELCSDTTKLRVKTSYFVPWRLLTARISRLKYGAFGRFEDGGDSGIGDSGIHNRTSLSARGCSSGQNLSWDPDMDIAGSLLKEADLFSQRWQDNEMHLDAQRQRRGVMHNLQFDDVHPSRQSLDLGLSGEGGRPGRGTRASGM